MSETREAPWIVQLKGNFDDDNRSCELSVVRADNKHGRRSWGWPDETKIILPEVSAASTTRVKEIQRIAKVICDALNAAEPPVRND